MGVPIVSSTSAGRGADEVKARAALTEASLCERGRLRKSCWRIMLSMAGVYWVVSNREGESRQRVPSSGVKFPLSADSIESDWLYVGKRGFPSILFPFFFFLFPSFAPVYNARFVSQCRSVDNQFVLTALLHDEFELAGRTRPSSCILCSMLIAPAAACQETYLNSLGTLHDMTRS
jgi:hypothetical protein